MGIALSVYECVSCQAVNEHCVQSKLLARPKEEKFLEATLKLLQDSDVCTWLHSACDSALY